MLPTEAINVPNTPITSSYQFRQTVARPPHTDRVARLDTKKMLGTAHALQTVATLNLDELGQTLKYRSTKNGRNTMQWQMAECEEIQRLLDTRTIRPIHSYEQPIDRKEKSDYYNPK